MNKKDQEANAIKGSIFRDYYSKRAFVDKYIGDKEQAVDVIIPIVHTNELWKNNLFSFYKEIPINRLLIGDGGCIDNSIDIVRKFPRVKVFDHRKIKTLGYSVRKLIEEVETIWFIYLHSDVYLPSGWFSKMAKYQKKYDWFGCPMINTILVEYPGDNNFSRIRPFAGSQMGKKIAFEEGLKNIDDDYVYRQEDYVFSAYYMTFQENPDLIGDELKKNKQNFSTNKHSFLSDKQSFSLNKHSSLKINSTPI